MGSFDDLKAIADEQLKRLNSASNLADAVISKLPDECKFAIPSAQKDVADAKKHLSNGDYNSMSDLLKKYADLNNKH